MIKYCSVGETLMFNESKVRLLTEGVNEDRFVTSRSKILLCSSGQLKNCQCN